MKETKPTGPWMDYQEAMFHQEWNKLMASGCGCERAYQILVDRGLAKPGAKVLLAQETYRKDLHKAHLIEYPLKPSDCSEHNPINDIP